jgi:hypothetical protein
MDKRQAIQRVKQMADLLRGEPQNILGDNQYNWHRRARLNCIGKALLSCVEKLERPAKDSKTFEGALDGADFYFKAAMHFLQKKPRANRKHLAKLWKENDARLEK